MLNNTSKTIVVKVSIIAVLSSLLLVYQIGIGFTTNDSLMFEIFSLRENMSNTLAILTHNQGRFQFYYLMYLAMFPHYFHNMLLYNIFTFLGISFAFLGFGYFMAYFTKNRLIGFLTVIYLLTMYQNGWGHNLITSYAFYFWIIFLSSIISAIFLDKFIVTRKKKYFALFFILSFFSFSYESMILFFIFFSIYISLKNWLFIKDNKAKLFALIYLPLILYLNTYFIYKMMTSSVQVYEGTKINFDIAALLQTAWQYSIGGFPGYYFYNGVYNNIIQNYSLSLPFQNIDLILTAIGISGFIKMISVIFVSTYIAKELRFDSSVAINSKTIINLAFVLFSFIFASNFLQALTPKYQEWVIKSSDISYIGSSFSAFSFIGLFVLGLMFITTIKSEKVYKNFLIIYIILLSTLSVMTSYTNFYIKQDQMQSNEKFLLLNKMIQSEPFKSIPPNSEICAPSLFTTTHGIFAPPEKYWSSYISLKRGYDEYKGLYIKNQNIEDSRYSLKYNEQIGYKPNTYMMLIDKASNDIFIYFNGKVSNFQLIGKVKESTLIEVYKNKFLIDKSMSNDRMFYIKNISMDKDDILHLHTSSIINEDSIFFNFSKAELNFSDIKYDFDTGFYPDETTHRWSGPNNNSTVKIVNSSDKKILMSINFSIYALKKKKIRVYLNDIFIKEVHIDAENMKYEVSLNNIIFKSGVNYLKFENMDGTQSPLVSGDTRKLGFAISNFMLSK